MALRPPSSFSSPLAVALAAVTVAAAPLAAQSVDPLQDARAKASDLAMTGGLQVGTALAAGPIGVGPQRSLGGLGHVRVGVRVSAVTKSVLPDILTDGVYLDGPQPFPLTALEVVVPVATVDGAIGVFKGLPLPQGRLGALDALVRATVLPSVQQEGLRFAPQTDGSNVALSGGARLSVIEGLPRVPAVSVVWFKREVPPAQFAFQQDGASVGVEAFAVQTETIRLQLSQRLGRVSLDLGAGMDETRLNAVTRVSIPEAGLASVDVLPEDVRSRARYFAGLTLPLGPLQVTGRVAQSRGAAPAVQSFLDVSRLKVITTAALTVGVRF